MLIEIHNKKQSGITTDNIRATTVAVFAKAMMDQREFPPLVIIHLRPNPILVGNVARTAELRFDEQNRPIITVCYANRHPDLINNSLVHELCHLIRAYNSEFHREDGMAEERDNHLEMKRVSAVVDWITNILVADANGDLDSIDEYTKTSQDPVVSGVVCNQGPGTDLGLQVLHEASGSSQGPC